MIKVIGVLMVVTTGGAVGLVKSHFLNSRVKFMESFLKFITYIQTEIRFSSDSIFKIIERYCGTDNSLPFLRDMEIQGETFTTSWESAIDKIPIEAGITEGDRELIHDFGMGLGVSDIEGQTAHCEIGKKLVQNRILDAREQLIKKGKLYRILGFGCGIGLALLMI